MRYPGGCAGIGARYVRELKKVLKQGAFQARALIMMGTFTGFLSLLAAGYTLLLILLYFGQEKILFYPRPSDPAIESRYRDQSVSFKTDDVELHGWFFPAGNEDQPTLVYYGGNGEELSTSINSLRELGDYSLVIINYRGYGRSTGRPGEKALKSDALFVLDTLESEGRISLSKTIILGRSLGTGVATYVAANRGIQGLILVSPFNSIEAIASDIYFYLPVRWLIRHPFRSIDHVDSIRVSTLIIKAETDRVVPAQYSDALIEAWAGPLQVVQLKGTNHNYIQTGEYVKSVGDFVGRVIPAGVP
jgi:uncharacterized protein